MRAKAALAKGDLPLAHQLSGHFYAVSGEVVHGNHLGRKLGFPTANLKLADDSLFLLPYGVYAVKAGFDNLKFNGMANAGVRPTVDGSKMTIEVHLLDFTGDLYGKVLTVEFVEYIRAEIKFDSLEKLVTQILEDNKKTLLIFS